MSIVINQNVPVVAAQGVTADVVLQPGSVINARVLQVLGNDQARIIIGGQSIAVLSQFPLLPGKALQLAVSQPPDGIRLAVVDQQGGASASQSLAGSAASLDQVTLTPGATVSIAAQTTSGIVAQTNQLTPQETLAVSTAAQIAATQQTSLAPLFANLGVAAGLGGLPPQVQLAVTQLLAQRTSLNQNLTGADLKRAFLNSGLFLEAHLATGSVPSVAVPDLKAALIVLRQVLAGSLATSLDGATVAQSATPQAAALPPATTVAQGTTLQAVVASQTATPAVMVLEQGAQPSISGLLQPIALPVASEPTASPALAPLLAHEIGPSDLSLQDAPLSILHQVLDFGAAKLVAPPALTPADAAARAAANTAGLSLLQETLQASRQFALNSGLVLDDGLMLSLLPAVTGTRARDVGDAAFARTNV